MLSSNWDNRSDTKKLIPHTDAEQIARIRVIFLSEAGIIPNTPVACRLDR
jgi:hypothetical protein